MAKGKYGRKKKLSGKTLGIGIAGAIGVFALIYVLAFSGWSPFAQDVTDSNTSTFKLISYVDGEDVSDFIEISIWVPDDNAEFDEIADIYTWSNFEEEESSKDADDVSIDLSGYEYVWLEIDPDAESVFQNTHYLITPASKNYAFKYYVKQVSTDVNFMALTNVSATAWENFTVSNNAGGVLATQIMIDRGIGNIPFGYDGIFNSTGELPSTFPREATQMNMTMILDVPDWTHDNFEHHGANWDVENTDYDDFSTAELEFMHAERNWRCQAPTYDPAADLEKNGEEGLFGVTNAFCIRWTYNTTVSTADAATTQVNMTLNDNTPAEVIVDGTFIYMIFYEVIDFEDGAYVIEFEYEEAHRIYATAVQSGRIVVPRGSQSLGAFTAYSTIGL